MIGIDEVGRGAWAGPMLIVAARQKSSLPKGITDSKALSRTKRESLVEDIATSCDIGEGWVEPQEIDNLGLAKATKLGVKRALEAIGALEDEEIIIDGHINFCEAKFKNVKAIIKADLSVPVVGAASIYAKVVRDTYMANLPTSYDKYDFGLHVGYGTAVHKNLLNKHGISDIHRKSYKPITMLLNNR